MLPLLRRRPAAEAERPRSAPSPTRSRAAATSSAQNLVDTDDYLASSTSTCPRCTTDICELADVADTYSTAAPDCSRSWTNSRVTSRTVIDQQADSCAQFLAMDGSLRRHRHRLPRPPTRPADPARPGLSRPVLGDARQRTRRSTLPINGLAQLAPKIETVFGTGGDRHWLHISLIPRAAPSRRRAVHGAPDDCPTVHRHGIAARSTARTAAASSAGHESLDTIAGDRVPVEARSGACAEHRYAPLMRSAPPAEQKLIAQIVGADRSRGRHAAVTDRDVADLLRPVLRGTVVTAP